MSRRRRRPEEHLNHDRWLVSYADFITLLFAFFTTLYAISTVDQHKAGKLMMSMMEALHVDFFPEAATGSKSGPAQAGTTDESLDVMARKLAEDRRARLVALAGEMQSLVDRPELGGKIQMRLEPRGVVLSLAEAGFFESGSAELRAGARDALELVARRLVEKPDLSITVEGHTDDVPVKGGRYANNWELSTARSTFVVAFLISRGIEPRRLSAAGYAEHRPVSANDTAEGRARNRRVDMVLETTPAPGTDYSGADSANGSTPAGRSPPDPAPSLRPQAVPSTSTENTMPAHARGVTR